MGHPPNLPHLPTDGKYGAPSASSILPTLGRFPGWCSPKFPSKCHGDRSEVEWGRPLFSATGTKGGSTSLAMTVCYVWDIPLGTALGQIQSQCIRHDHRRAESHPSKRKCGVCRGPREPGYFTGHTFRESGLELVAQIGSDSEWALQEMLLIGVSCCHDADRSAVEAD